jgi:outer membrane protein OmpA-like peptidoglycan-associated protein
MKKILAAILALSLLHSKILAQDDEIRPAAIGISFILNDFTTADRIRSSSLSSVLSHKQWAKFREMSPGIAVSYFKGLRKHIDFAGTLAGSFVNYELQNRQNTSGDKFLLEADAAVNLKLVSEKYWVQPYVIAGIGAQMYSGIHFGAFIPTGAGIKINLFDDAQIFVNSQYRIPVTKETANYHFLNQVGIAGRIGVKKEPALKPLPPTPPPPPPAPPADRDKDGVIDSLDKCPDQPGLSKYDGCPVPDTDHDGINDEDDKCPDKAGVARYQGCPVPDTDKDGINDEEDRCPSETGPASNQGCPEIKEEVLKKVNYAAQNIYFATGKATLLSKSFKGLDEVAKVLKDDTRLKLAVDGHTDNVGADDFNQKLSENRAASVKAYLVKKGVDPSRITSAGYGETHPVSDNKTAAGKQQNRRVELKLNY